MADVWNMTSQIAVDSSCNSSW